MLNFSKFFNLFWPKVFSILQTTLYRYRNECFLLDTNMKHVYRTPLKNILLSAFSGKSDKYFNRKTTVDAEKSDATNKSP